MAKFSKLVSELILWILVTAFANAIGLAVGFGFITKDSDWIITFPVGFTIIGILSGFGQWVMLDRQLDKVRAWIPLTILGHLLGFVLGFIFYTWLYRGDWTRTFVISIMIGTVLGVFQWLVLHNKVKYSLWWIPISILSWGIGEHLSFAILNRINFYKIIWAYNNLTSGAIGGMLLGILVGIVNGVSIALMLSKSNEKINLHEKEISFVKNAS